MKNFKIILFLLPVLILNSCSNSLLDEIDTDPNKTADVPIKTLLTQVTTGVPFNVTGTDLAWYTSIFVEQTGGVHGQMEETEERLNGVNSNAYENSWLFIYPRLLKDMQILQKKAAAEDNDKALGITQVLECFTYSILCDLFGEIPYSEALMGDEGVDRPKYDQQTDVYAGILSKLDNAIAKLNTNNGIVGGEDFIYSGDADKWKMTAYALKARIMNRTIGTGVKKPDGSDITNADILSAISNAFSSPADNFSFTSWQDAQGWRNPWFQQEIERGHHSISRTFYDLLDSKSDPRLALSVDDSQVDRSDPAYDPENLKGRPAGPDGISDQSKTAYPIISTNILHATSEMPMLTYAELKFIEAETQERQAAGSGEQAWRDGIKASLTWFGADVESTYAQDVTYGTTADERLQRIIEEKYVALWPFGSIEAYSEYRRTGYPQLNNPLNPEKFPVRLHYVENELTTNKSNVPDVNIYTDKLIWAN